jgi:hypothetical protein
MHDESGELQEIFRDHEMGLVGIYGLFGNGEGREENEEDKLTMKWWKTNLVEVES